MTHSIWLSNAAVKIPAMQYISVIQWNISVHSACTLSPLEPATNQAILYADHGELPKKSAMPLLWRGCSPIAKSTNTGLLLRCHSHVDNRYKQGLLVTMLDRAHRLSSSWAHFSEECERLRGVFRKLRYPNRLTDSVINRFITSRVAGDMPKQHTDDVIRIVIPYNKRGWR